MHKSLISIFLIIVFCHSFLMGQETQTILRAPDSWTSELIPFPLGFAPAIDFVGFEDIRFAPGWSDADSKEFWTYHFSWFIERNGPLTEDFLSETLGTYYDGLSKAVLSGKADSAKAKSLDKTLCLFIKTEDGFRGKMRVFDSFFTKDYILLHVKVRESVCEKANKQIVSFDISPKDFGDEIWKEFEGVEVIWECK